MAGDPLHPAARAVRAARAYANMSRTQLGALVDVKPGTIGRWERGDWKDGPPRAPMLEKIARETEVYRMVEDLGAGEPDPAKRFAAVARREADRQRERLAGAKAVPPGEGATGGAS